ncbi:MAG: ABC transporter ATP-binding protein [Candidatus Aenigmarchaeota archaeon]|nr:ABC transporter ATP-binding protein [Candidatus Aenigmarchaeota archaeon]
MKTLLELIDINKTYKMGEVKLEVLKHVDLKIKKGELVALIGSSGSGKSTLLNILGCLDRPSAGKVYIDGKDTSKLTDDELAIIRGKKIGFIFQFFYLLPNLTALENVELPMMFADKKDKQKRAKDLMKLVGLEHRMTHYPTQMSGGEQQRVAIARALANEPEIILADEPTGNLDSKNGKEIMNILYKLNKQGITLLIVTHDKSISGNIDRKVYLKDGEII